MLLHGLGLNKTALTGAAIVLEEKFISYIAIDLPGHGYAKDIKVSDLGEVAAYLEKILEKENINRVVVMGYSIGGLIGLYLSKHWSERVAALILVASPYEISIRTVKPFFVFIGFPVCMLVNTVVRWFSKTDPEVDFTQPTIMNSDFAVLWWSSIATSAQGAKNVMQAIGSASLITQLQTMACPLLLVEPLKDQFFSKKCYAKMKESAGGSLLRVNSSHNVMPKLSEITERAISDYPNISKAIFADL